MRGLSLIFFFLFCNCLIVFIAASGSAERTLPESVGSRSVDASNHVELGRFPDVQDPEDLVKPVDDNAVGSNGDDLPGRLSFRYYPGRFVNLNHVDTFVLDAGIVECGSNKAHSLGRLDLLSRSIHVDNLRSATYDRTDLSASPAVHFSGEK